MVQDAAWQIWTQITDKPFSGWCGNIQPGRYGHTLQMSSKIVHTHVIILVDDFFIIFEYSLFTFLNPKTVAFEITAVQIGVNFYT